MKNFLSYPLVAVVACAGIMTAQAQKSYQLKSIKADHLNERREYSYDEAGRLVEIDKVSENDDGSERLVKEFLTYDENGNCTKLSTWQYLAQFGDYIEVSYCEYVYNELGQKIQRDVYNITSDWEFEHGSTYEYIYDADGRLKTRNLVISYIGTYESVEYSYDKNGNLESEEAYMLDFFTYQLALQVQTYYTYEVNPDGSGKSYLTSIEYLVPRSANSDEFEADSYYEYSYDENWNLISEISYNGQKTSKLSETTYAYGDIPAASIDWPISPEEENDNFVYHTVNADITSRVIYVLSYDGEFVFYDSYTYAYDKIGADSGLGGIVNTESVMTIRWFDGAYLSLDGVEAGELIRIYGTDGREVSRVSYIGNAIDTSALPAGLYFAVSKTGVVRFVK